jgi:hypothetical protein
MYKVVSYSTCTKYIQAPIIAIVEIIIVIIITEPRARSRHHLVFSCSLTLVC